MLYIIITRRLRYYLGYYRIVSDYSYTTYVLQWVIYNIECKHMLIIGRIVYIL